MMRFHNTFQILVNTVLAATFTFVLLSGCASSPNAPAEARNALAPTGKLRVGLILANPVLERSWKEFGVRSNITTFMHWSELEFAPTTLQILHDVLN